MKASVFPCSGRRSPAARGPRVAAHKWKSNSRSTPQAPCPKRRTSYSSIWIQPHPAARDCGAEAFGRPTERGDTDGSEEEPANFHETQARAGAAGEAGAQAREEGGRRRGENR